MPRFGSAQRARIHLAADELTQLDREVAEIMALLDREVILSASTELLTERHGFHIAWLAERDDEGSVVIRRLSGNRTDRFQGLTLRRGCGLGGKVFAIGGTEWVDDYFASREITHDYDAQVAGESVQRMLAAPIIHDDQCVGVLFGGLRDSGTFGNRAAAVVETVARSTAQALLVAERARHAAELAVHEERQRMAIDLHDTIGAMLFAITAGVRRVTEEAGGDSLLRERLRAIERQASDAAVTLREALRALRTPPAQIALGAALESACAAFRVRSGITANLVMLDVLPSLREEATRTLIAAAREGLLNVEKHAHAESVVVTVAMMGQGVALTVTDDGVGLHPPEDGHDGFGLAAIAGALGEQHGRLDVTANADGGTSFRAWLPY